MRVLEWFSLGVLGLSLGGCYDAYGYQREYPTGYPVHRASLSVQVAPPEPLVEAPPPRPIGGVVWTAGFWDWQGSRYVWMPGRWASAPSSGVVFQPPRWQRTRFGWERAPARWVPGESTDRFGRHVWYDALGRPHYM